MNSLQTLEVLLRGVAVGAMLCTALALIRGRPLIAARWTGALFALASAAFTLHSGGPETRVVMPIIFPIWLLSLGGTAYFWMFGMALFEDSRFTLDRWIPAAVMTIVGVAGVLTPRPMNRGVWIVHNLLEVALILHIVSVIWRRRAGDLVEARRALRAPVMLLIGLYAIVLAIFEIGWDLGFDEAWSSPLQAASLALVSLLTAAAFLQARPELFVAARPAVAPDAVDPQDRPALARLFMLHQIARNVIGHAGYELFPARRDGRPMFDWMTTVTHHDLHHAQAGSNFGLYFTWWDRLMGTENPRYHEQFAKLAARRRLTGAAETATV